MQAIRSARTRQMDAPIETNHASLELIASEQPPLLEFQAHVLANSTMSFAVEVDRPWIDAFIGPLPAKPREAQSVR